MANSFMLLITAIVSRNIFCHYCTRYDDAYGKRTLFNFSVLLFKGSHLTQ